MQAKALKKDKELSDDKEINVDNKTGQEEITQTNQLELIPKTYKPPKENFKNLQGAKTLFCDSQGLKLWKLS